jgi:hypothetical protein
VVPGRADTALTREPAVTVVAATRLEAWAVRRALPGARVVEAGVGLIRLRGDPPGPVVVTCGLAGALRPDLPTGTVIVPEAVRRPGGAWVACDPALVASLVAAARRLGFEPERGPLATAPALVRGAARTWWAGQGCAAVDMETGLLTAPRVAAVRVILDTPERDLSEVWRRPLLAFACPAAWREAAWLCREAPRCARRAAAVLAAALSPAP